MSPVQKKIYLVLFSIILIALLFAIFKLTQQNNLPSSAEPNFIAPETQNIDWQTASKLMEDCKVKVIFQKHNLEVILRTHDHQIFQTIEPKIDDIFNLAKKYQGPCDIVQMISE